MSARTCLLASLIVVFFGGLASRAQAGDSPSGSGKKKGPAAKTDDAPKFIRVVRNSQKQPLALETATGHYVLTSNGKTVIVDLIGCIHIADKKYYEALNERFKNYGSVLFELVMPEGQTLKGLGTRKSNHPVARIQQSLPKILDLSFQLKDVDYTAKNFVHADLSPDEMAKAIQSRGDTGESVFLKVLFDVFNEASRLSAEREKQQGIDLTGFQLLAALIDPNRPLALKRMIADQMDLVGTGTGLGATLDTILVEDRNLAALKVLGRELKKGTLRIAIFYGAAHMPDFDRRLRNDLKFKRENLTWDRAWDLSGK